MRKANLATRLENATSLSEEEVARLREELGKVVADDKLEAGVSAVRRVLGDGEAEQGRITIRFAQAAMAEIERQRAELIAPLDQLEADALAQLRGTYAELIQMQNSVTAFVTSVRKVQVEQNEILKRLNLLETRDRVIEQTIKVNDAIVKATAGTGKAMEVIEKGESH